MPSRSRHNYVLGQGFGQSRPSSSCAPHRRRLAFETLEHRDLLALVTVNSLLDNGDGANTTLREAISIAAPGDTIVFQGGLSGTINLTSTGDGHLTISKNLTIQGPSANLITVRAFDPNPNSDGTEHARRVFYIKGSGTLNVTISGLTMTGGDPDVSDDEGSAGGGVIHNEENLTLSNCVLTNSNADAGGAILNYSGTLNVTDCIISGNTSLDGGGILVSGGTAVITRTQILNNEVSNSGGGIWAYGRPVTVIDSTISGNHAEEHGGGIYSYNGGALMISGTTISGNSADANNTLASTDGGGGGIIKIGGALTIDNSTIDGNTTGRFGGGILILTSSTSAITSSTISGNAASGRGGGIYSDSDSNVLSVNHSTVAFNTSPSGGSAGAGFRSANRTILNHTLIASNLRGSSPDDVSGTFTANSSLVGNAGSASITNNSSIVGTTQAMLGPLADNGDRTRTHTLLAGSVAIDAGNASIASPPLFDQRGAGFTRIIDGDNNAAAVIDIGAYERALPANLVVDIATDENDFNYAPGDLSLREALIIANGSVGVADTISFHAFLSGSTINLTLGALPVTDAVIINGLGANLLTVSGSGNGANRIFNIDDGSAGTAIVVALAGLTLTGGNITGDGGAIRNTETLSLTHMAISSNSATALGGGIKNEQGNLTITDSTFSGNSAATGGAIWTDTNLTTQTTTIVGSTISGNTATASGGGVFNSDGLTVIRHSTVTNNTATAAGGGGLGSAANATTRTEVQSTIVAANTNSDVAFVTGATNSFQSNGYNIVGSGNANGEFVETGDRRNITNPSLGALANNGGPTLTHAPLLGSLAINTGDPNAQPNVGNVPLNDQRGAPNTRVFGGQIDVGAVEFQSSVAPLSLVVDIATDEHDGNFSAGDLSLREALAIANSNSGVTDAISFDASLTGQSINLTLGSLPITDAVVINGLGASALTVDASGNDGNRTFNIDDGDFAVGMSVSISGLKLTGGDVSGEGGAILLDDDHLTLSNMVLTGNSAGSGGAISMGAGTLQIVASTVSGNHASTLGGGVKNLQGNFEVIDSTFSGNTATVGAGIWSDTNLATQATTIINSTISGNTASGAGGGVFNTDGLVIIKHSTITANTAPNGAGSGVASTGNATTRTEVSTSIISGNTGSDLDLVSGATNSFQSNGHNMVGSTATSTAEFVETGDIINSNPMLEAIADNGGLTMTHLLVTGSPALNAGGIATPGSGGVPMFDQRGTGLSRVLGSQLDIGAVEMPAPAGPELPGDYNLDGDVNAADYVVWRKTFGLGVPQYEGADGDGDTTIGNGDYTVWTDNFSETSSGSGGGEISETTADTGERAVSDHDVAMVAFAANSVTSRTRTLGAAPHAAVTGTAHLLNVLDSRFDAAEESSVESDSLALNGVESNARDEALNELYFGIADDFATAARSLVLP